MLYQRTFQASKIACFSCSAVQERQVFAAGLLWEVINSNGCCCFFVYVILFLVCYLCFHNTTPWIFLQAIDDLAVTVVCHLQMKVIEHSVETLKAALVSKRRDLVKLYKEYSAEERRFLEEGLRPGEPDALFQLITLHSDSDWISAHPEQPQNFESFYMDSHRRTPSARHNTIYIQTIGEYFCSLCGQ